MRNKKILLASFFIAFLFGFPMNWLYFKGDTGIDNIVQLFSLNRLDIFYDFSILFINTLILYWVLLLFINKLKPVQKNEHPSDQELTNVMKQ